uniref:Mitochondrial import inner membrane translocase subunit n=1 Tax=Anopheles epiroticus TaxID=199890 RepID=A0A182PN56_9DIPT
MRLGHLGKIGIGWGIISVLGIAGFVASKNSVDKNRYENMKIRERMRQSNVGQYENGPAMSMPDLNAAQQAKLQLMQEMEIEMMSDLYSRMTQACHKKCIPPKYADSELGKGESVCIDRCVAKYLEVHERIGKKLTAMSAQDEDLKKKMGV